MKEYLKNQKTEVDLSNRSESRKICERMINLLGIDKKKLLEPGEGHNKKEKPAYLSEDDYKRIFTRTDDSFGKDVAIRFLTTVDKMKEELKITPEQEIRYRDLVQDLIVCIQFEYTGVVEPTHFDDKSVRVNISEVLTHKSLYILDKYFDQFISLEIEHERVQQIRLINDKTKYKVDFLSELLLNLNGQCINLSEHSLGQIKRLFELTYDINSVSLDDVKKLKSGTLRKSIFNKINDYNSKNANRSFSDIYTTIRVLLDPINISLVILDMINPNKQPLSVTLSEFDECELPVVHFLKEIKSREEDRNKLSELEQEHKRLLEELDNLNRKDDESEH